MKGLFILAIFCSWGFPAVTQTKYTISGYVRDEKSGEELIGTTVFLKVPQTIGTITNAYGFYSITIPDGNYTVTAQFIGYEAKSATIDLKQNTKLNFTLNEKVSELDEVVVTGTKKDENITKNLMGVEKINTQEIKNIPVIFGEKDILKTIQLLPGVKSAGEGNSGFYVRGGNADQNLILLDEATVYNASHLLGFFSVFNADAIKDVSLYKGTQQAEYGGRLSSVLDIKMQEGNDKKFGVEGGLGLISSRLKIEGPIIKNKGSFSVAGRRSYADLFLKLAKDSAFSERRLYFYDLNAKLNYRINDNNRIFLSGYFGKDVLSFEDQIGVDWGNITGTLRWNHLVNEKIFLNTSLIFSNYDYFINTSLAGTDGEIISRIQDYNFKQDFQYFPSPKNSIKFGFNSIYHKIIPGAITKTTNLSVNELNLAHKQALENALYFSHEYRLSDIFFFEYGLRLTSFSALGPGDFYSYNVHGEPVDTVSYNSGEFIKTYINMEPRFAANYILNKKNSIKFSYTRNTQNLHLLSNSTSGNPTDLWIPSSNNVKPEISDQISLGYFRNFKDDAFEFSTEIYYKYLQNQIDYKDGAELRFNEYVESQLLFGTGRAYGVEFFLKKKYGRLNGWIGYTLARTEKKIGGINNGEYYPAKQDRTHDISIVGIYELSRKWTISATWVYYTGNAVTFPSGKYEIDGQIVSYYTERNGYRMPEYHRLDLGVTWQKKKTDKFESSWNFSLYNAYGRENAYTITFQEDPNDPVKTQAVQTTLFRWVPSITYNFKF
ncbi:TonB-dependent receptor [uncultured Draconibacterium sp.]|uniref:TonB-dependent receptor n=1 Tax=uncultured Draconibacterium sp. TaxID=1573823 RepID=UPI0032169000